jgi:hypothetical protein
MKVADFGRELVRVGRGNWKSGLLKSEGAGVADFGRSAGLWWRYWVVEVACVGGAKRPLFWYARTFQGVLAARVTRRRHRG